MNLLPKLATRDRIIDAVLVVSCGILQAVALAFAAFATRDAFATLHAGSMLTNKTIGQLAISGLVAAICLFISRYRAEALGQSYAISLRRALYQQIARLPKSRHEERRLGSLSLRFVGDLSAARLWFGRGLPDIWSAAAVVPGAAIILFFLDPTLAINGIAMLGITLCVMSILAWQLERRHRGLRRRRASIAISMIERIAIAPELDLMGRTGRELRKLDEQGASLRSDAISRRGRTVSLQAVLQLGIALTGLLMLWQASRNGIAPATVAACLSVMALIALPLQNLAGAWDQYCAWRVAREKIERLLSEPKVVRTGAIHTKPSAVEITGEIDGTPIARVFETGTISKITGKHANRLARCIAGLDSHESLSVRYNGQQKTPRVAFIGDDHVGLQGSLRRSATLMCRKRPRDARITEVMQRFGLSNLLAAPHGLDQRVAEKGNGLSSHQTLCLDLTRAVLGKADVIIIASVRWASWHQQQAKLLETMHQLSAAPVILADDTAPFYSNENLKVD